MNKKGGSFDQIYFVVIFFTLVVGVITIHAIWTDHISTDDIFDETAVGSKIRTRTTTSMNSLDNSLMIIYIFVHLGIIILAFLLRVHPVFAVGAIIISIFLVMLAAPLSNAFEDIMDDSFYDNSKSSFTKVRYVIAHLVELELVWFFITAIVTYGVSRYDTAYQ